MRLLTFVSSTACIVALAVSATAQTKTVDLRFGPVWPRDLLDSEKATAWDAAVGYGVTVDRVVGFGIVADFMWNRNEKTETIGSIEVPYQDVGTYMFPVSGFIVLDPVPDLVVRPVLRFAVGYNSLIYNYDIDTSLSDEQSDQVDPDGYYYGLYLKPSLEAAYNFTEAAGVYAGLEYQWAKTTSAKEYTIEDDGETRTGNRVYNMSGLGLRMGLRLHL